jgi:hypothetical protein
MVTYRYNAYKIERLLMYQERKFEFGTYLIKTIHANISIICRHCLCFLLVNWLEASDLTSTILSVQT